MGARRDSESTDLLHILHDTVFGQELFRLVFVVEFGFSQKGLFEGDFVDIESAFRAVVVVDAKRDYQRLVLIPTKQKRQKRTEGIDNALDLRVLNGLAISLPLHKTQDGRHDIVLCLGKHVFLPANQV